MVQKFIDAMQKEWPLLVLVALLGGGGSVTANAIYNPDVTRLVQAVEQLTDNMSDHETRIRRAEAIASETVKTATLASYVDRQSAELVKVWANFAAIEQARLREFGDLKATLAEVRAELRVMNGNSAVQAR